MKHQSRLKGKRLPLLKVISLVASSETGRTCLLPRSTLIKAIPHQISDSTSHRSGFSDCSIQSKRALVLHDQNFNYHRRPGVISTRSCLFHIFWSAFSLGLIFLAGSFSSTTNTTCTHRRRVHLSHYYEPINGPRIQSHTLYTLCGGADGGCERCIEEARRGSRAVGGYREQFVGLSNVLIADFG